ncbi:MAG: hypothetical protein M1120_03920 [Patescibacteria group bacterium]|nr:hypothetical protein [Patescibacteria group bacterium]
MQKKLLLLIPAVLFLLVDVFASLYFIAGKTPAQTLSFSSPKITITPFPTLITENFNSNMASDANTAAGFFPPVSMPSVNVNGVIFPYKNLNSGDDFKIICSYQSDLQFKTTAGLYFLSEKNLPYLVKIFPDLSIEKGDKKLNVETDQTKLIPKGSYKAILNLYNPDNWQLIANCVSGQFSFDNNNSFVATGLDLDQNNIISQADANKPLHFFMHSFKTFKNLQARIIVSDPVVKGKAYYVKDLEPLSLTSGEDKTLSWDLSDFSLIGTYLINLELKDQSGNVVSVSPIQAFYAGRLPKISKVSLAAAGSNYQINLNYEGAVPKDDEGLEISAVVCNNTDCDFSNWVDLGNGWPKNLLIANKKLSSDKNKVSIKVRWKNTFGYLFTYHNY